MSRVPREGGDAALPPGCARRDVVGLADTVHDVGIANQTLALVETNDDFVPEVFVELSVGVDVLAESHDSARRRAESSGRRRGDFDVKMLVGAKLGSLAVDFVVVQHPVAVLVQSDFGTTSTRVTSAGGPGCLRSFRHAPVKPPITTKTAKIRIAPRMLKENRP
jgi:hypothetical protein